MLKFKNNMVIHCPERWQAENLVKEAEVPERNSKAEAIAGWDKYRENMVYGVMWRPSYENPTIVWYAAIDDESLREMKITEYMDIEEVMK